jgi:hypothetical protein
MTFVGNHDSMVVVWNVIPSGDYNLMTVREALLGRCKFPVSHPKK